MKRKSLKVFNSFTSSNEEDARESANIPPVENLKKVNLLIEKIYAEELKKPVDKKLHFS